MYIAEIRENATGDIERVAFDHPEYDVWGPNKQFDWEENNFSCDCNRHLLFWRNRGDEEHGWNTTCSEGRFSVRITADGEIVYDEFCESVKVRWLGLAVT